MMMMTRMTKMTNRHLWVRERCSCFEEKNTLQVFLSHPLFLFKHFSNKNREIGFNPSPKKERE